MKIYDPLYGEFQLSELSSTLASAPEVRRLSQVRLLNTMTPTLATLGELRRYAHTLGVLYLFGEWRKARGLTLPHADLDALEVAIILHDVATPPFGHLFEYLLKEELGWDHESAASQTLLQQHVAENSGHQIFVGRTPKVQKLIHRLKVDLDTVVGILRKEHPLHVLIFGSLDFDNIDNVWRMAWALGFRADAGEAQALARMLAFSAEGIRLESSAAPLINKWAQLRKQDYQVLVFDHATVASQAVLTKALRLALRSGLISPDDWTLTDEQLLERLLKDRSTKRLISDDYLGAVPRPLMTIQFPWMDTLLFAKKREELETIVLEIAEQAIGVNCMTYVFKERGTFSKRLSLVNEAGKVEGFGHLSTSLIVYLFSSSSKFISEKVLFDLLIKLCAFFEVELKDLIRIFIKNDEVSQKNSLFLDL